MGLSTALYYWVRDNNIVVSEKYIRNNLLLNELPERVENICHETNTYYKLLYFYWYVFCTYD